MKKVFTVLFAGTLFATVALADSDANARYRMKTGRDLPWVEQERAHARAVEAERVGYIAPEIRVAPASNDAETRYWMKTGRHTPAEEKRLAALDPVPKGFSNLSPAHNPPHDPPHNDAEERLRMKTGRATPAS